MNAEQEYARSLKNKPWHHPATLLGKDDAELQRLCDEGEITPNDVTKTRFKQQMMAKYGQSCGDPVVQQFRRMQEKQAQQTQPK